MKKFGSAYEDEYWQGREYGRQNACGRFANFTNDENRNKDFGEKYLN